MAAKNNLISSWIDYEVARIEIFVELELLYLDQDGTWTNESFNPDLSESISTDEAPPETLPNDLSNDPTSANGITDLAGTESHGDIGTNQSARLVAEPIIR